MTPRETCLHYLDLLHFTARQGVLNANLQVQDEISGLAELKRYYEALSYVLTYCDAESVTRAPR